MSLKTGPQVARAIGIPYTTLQYWVARGLLHPANSRHGTGNHAIWRRRDVRRALLVKQLMRWGLDSSAVRNVLETLGEPEGDDCYVVVNEKGHILQYADIEAARDFVGTASLIRLRLLEADA